MSDVRRARMACQKMGKALRRCNTRPNNVMSTVAVPDRRRTLRRSQRALRVELPSPIGRATNQFVFRVSSASVRRPMSATTGGAVGDFPAYYCLEARPMGQLSAREQER